MKLDHWPVRAHAIWDSGHHFAPSGIFERFSMTWREQYYLTFPWHNFQYVTKMFPPGMWKNCQKSLLRVFSCIFLYFNVHQEHLLLLSCLECFWCCLCAAAAEHSVFMLIVDDLAYLSWWWFVRQYFNQYMRQTLLKELSRAGFFYQSLGLMKKYGHFSRLIWEGVVTRIID